MRSRRFLVAVAPLALVASLSLAQRSPAASDGRKAPDAPRHAASPPGGPAGRTEKGLVVFIDPVTGKIRQPAPAEIGTLRALPAAVTPDVEGELAMKFGPGGAVGIVLDSRFESFMVVTKTPDGKLAMDCVIGGRKADAAISAGAKPAAKAGKEAPHVR